MKSKFFSAGLAAVILTVSMPWAAAQSLHDWGAVQSVPVNDQLIVKQKDGKTITGDMIEATATNLSIDRNGKAVNIARDNIREIHRSKGKSQKAKWAAIGAGAGAGVGAGIAAAQYSQCSSDCGIYFVADMGIGAGLGALAGFAIGASRRSRELIYTAP